MNKWLSNIFLMLMVVATQNSIAEEIVFTPIPKVNGKFKLQELVLYSTPGNSCQYGANGKICIPIADFNELCKQVKWYGPRNEMGFKGAFREIIRNDNNAVVIGKTKLNAPGECEFIINVKGVYDGNSYNKNFRAYATVFNYTNGGVSVYDSVIDDPTISVYMTKNAYPEYKK